MRIKSDIFGNVAWQLFLKQHDELKTLDLVVSRHALCELGQVVHT